MNKEYIIKKVKRTDIIDCLEEYNFEPTEYNIERVLYKIKDSVLHTNMAVYFLFNSSDEAHHAKSLARKKKENKK